jgi:hypothetical protein
LVAAERPKEAVTVLAGTAGSALVLVRATAPLIAGRGAVRLRAIVAKGPRR